MKAHLIKDTKGIAFYSADTGTVLELPFVEHGITAGFPFPADDFLEEGIINAGFAFFVGSHTEVYDGNDPSKFLSKT